MPKRREPALAIKEASNTPTPAQIEAFAAGADGEVTTQNAILDSDASRDFKAIRLPFNELYSLCNAKNGSRNKRKYIVCKIYLFGTKKVLIMYFNSAYLVLKKHIFGVL